MMLYTKKVASRYVRDPADLLAMGIEQANETFRNSGLGNISLRLVHTQAIDYDESEGEHFDHLYRMVDGVGAFKDVRKLRNEKKADIVGLVVDDASGCGLSTRVAPDSEDAYFVAHHSCAAITISIAHEIGHILGARHDRAIDTNNAPFAYGHGYVNGKWRDIMSYQQSCDGCVRIPFWSNPRVTLQGRADRHGDRGQRPRDPRAGRARLQVQVSLSPAGDQVPGSWWTSGKYRSFHDSGLVLIAPVLYIMLSASPTRFGVLPKM